MTREREVAGGRSTNHDGAAGEAGGAVGRTRVQHDLVTEAPVRAMRALLDRDPAGVGSGDPLPPGWHWLFFNPATRRSALGPDGHARRGSFLPEVSLPSRMWAGGRLRFSGALRIGTRAERRSRVLSVEEKEGRSGRLVFVTVGHEVAGADGVAVREEQDLVYREPRRDGGGFRGPEAPGDPDRREGFAADAVTLFRFSALTFNGHRIHYDHPWATGVEGYPGLVVHGPLLALLLLDAGARWSGAAPAAFSYRALSPLFCDEEFVLAGREEAEGTWELWAAHPERGVAMRASLELAS